MSDRIMFKYPIPAGEFEIHMPMGAVVRHVAVQGIRDACLWAEVDPAAPTVPRRFKVFATGEPIAATWVWVGTFLVSNGALVFHLFEKPISCEEPT